MEVQVPTWLLLPGRKMHLSTAGHGREFVLSSGTLLMLLWLGGVVAPCYCSSHDLIIAVVHSWLTARPPLISPQWGGERVPHYCQVGVEVQPPTWSPLTTEQGASLSPSRDLSTSFPEAFTSITFSVGWGTTVQPVSSGSLTFVFGLCELGLEVRTCFLCGVWPQKHGYCLKFSALLGFSFPSCMVRGNRFSLGNFIPHPLVFLSCWFL